jgi:myosin heavy chain 9/10/11/14
VRCIVPNHKKQPGKIDVPLVLDQLRCNGVLEGIRIARLGYPNRLPFVEFRHRYEVLLDSGIIPAGYMDGRKACQRMVKELGLDQAKYKIGKTKIFFKAGELALLEEKRDAHLYDIFARVQAACKKYTAQRRLQKFLNRAGAARTIQRNARIYTELKNWPWWPLYARIRPLLTATRADEELRRRERDLTIAKERAEREVKEKERLAQLKASLEAEKRAVEEALAGERTLLAEKNSQLQRLITEGSERDAVCLFNSSVRLSETD